MGLLHAIASCLDCGWETTSRNAMALGTRHHLKTGHQVTIEQCHSFTWLRKKPSQAEQPIEEKGESKIDTLRSDIARMIHNNYGTMPLNRQADAILALPTIAAALKAADAVGYLQEEIERLKTEIRALNMKTTQV